ncbi:hypothetical protein VTJ83DRAFT_3565 [Remersonia thermophila]|uniref:Uncharacterized protein n=1 Tax=Remersonia thermophila TaxID=72144 RepID=A0ABR4DEH2_9PEZI
MLGFDRMLNRSAEESAYSSAGSMVQSPEPTEYDSPGSSILRHKYSHSGSSAASFTSSSTTWFGSHSRKSSAATNPETPSTDHFVFSENLNETFKLNPLITTARVAGAMADPVDPSGRHGADPTAVPASQHLCDRVSNLVVEDMDRAESPTDAVMPLMRRPTASNGPNR